MANHEDLSGVFLALSDPTRREVIRILGAGPASVGELAQSFAMTLPSFMKHVHTLEGNGLIRSVKHGRVRTCSLDRDRLAVVGDWLDTQYRIWDARADRLDESAAEQEEV
ncbi:metalloregulator ArsR/SmtB family transcription factor [Microbacterium sp. NPDC089320]|uniref:ArsR/SmtB family transcription factor n=1 Tax=Microbacterium sp. NPDC089320 TaxID=3155182 RepID=UPI0034218EB8